MLILICDWFPVYKNGIPTGEKEYVASQGVDYLTGKTIIVQCEHPSRLGAKWNESFGEWVIEN